jgi:hypothetical protein
MYALNFGFLQVCAFFLMASYPCHVPRRRGNYAFKTEADDLCHFVVDGICAVYNGNCQVSGQRPYNVMFLTRLRNVRLKCKIAMECRDIMNDWYLKKSVPAPALAYIRKHHPNYWARSPFLRNAVINFDDAKETVESDSRRASQPPSDLFDPADYISDCQGVRDYDNEGGYVSSDFDLGEPDESGEMEEEENRKFDEMLMAGALEFIDGNDDRRIKLSFIRLLQHWSVDCRIAHVHVTKLLKLLKYHKPHVIYSHLPSTAKTLLKLGPGDKAGVTRISLKSKKDVVIGTYVHYGLESGVFGDSAGLLYIY